MHYSRLRRRIMFKVLCKSCPIHLSFLATPGLMVGFWPCWIEQIVYTIFAWRTHYFSCLFKFYRYWTLPLYNRAIKTLFRIICRRFRASHMNSQSTHICSCGSLPVLDMYSELRQHCLPVKYHLPIRFFTLLPNQILTLCAKGPHSLLKAFGQPH